MTNEKIKFECEAQYKLIADAQEKLKDIRSLCKHEDTFEGLYSYRIGSVLPAIICTYCGTLIKYKNL